VALVATKLLQLEGTSAYLATHRPLSGRDGGRSAQDATATHSAGPFRDHEVTAARHHVSEKSVLRARSASLFEFEGQFNRNQGALAHGHRGSPDDRYLLALSVLGLASLPSSRSLARVLFVQ
jgi:hypothetical protein